MKRRKLNEYAKKKQVIINNPYNKPGYLAAYNYNEIMKFKNNPDAELFINSVEQMINITSSNAKVIIKFPDSFSETDKNLATGLIYSGSLDVDDIVPLEDNKNYVMLTINKK